MSQLSQLSPELTRGLLQVARALLVATRSWTLYPPEHPTSAQSVARFADAIQGGIAEAAALLHDRDILTISFRGDPPTDAIHALLRLLTMDASERRARGGPATIWAAGGHESIAIEQVDYEKVLAREEGEIPEPGRRDDLWRSIVMSISGAHSAVFDERAMQRLLAIAGSPIDIADLATAVASPKCTLDGSPMLTTQAAMVLAAFRHLTSIVSVKAPERLAEVMGHLTTAAAQLDPHVVMEVLQTRDDEGAVQVVGGMSAAFDDMKVAQLLATALALDGQASDRLATIFNTIAPDEDRRRRVMTLARSLLSETDFGRSGQFQVLWASAEELLVSYNDRAFVSETYRAELDGVGARAERMAAVPLPPELAEWVESLGQDNVRALSVRMLIDLFTIEDDPARAATIAADMEALTEDLLLSGAYADALTVARALQQRAATPKGLGDDAARQALDRLGESLAMRETMALVGDVDDASWAAIRAVVETIGITTVEAMKPVIAVEADSAATARLEPLVVGFGVKAVTRLASLVSDARWFVQRRAAKLLGRIAAPEAVPLLQPLLRQADPRVAREAVAALGAIQDPAAARAIQTVLRAASGDLRKAVIDALVAERDARVVPMLVRILEESQPLGSDHDMVIETIDALGTVGTDGAVPVLANLARRRSFLKRGKARALKEHCVAALARVGTPKAAAAVEEAALRGDRMLKRIAAKSRGSGLEARG